MSVFGILKHGALKVTVFGAGNWGTAVAGLVAESTLESYIFHKTVTLWINDEIVEGRHLSEIINETHENVKYLPGIKLPDNVVAEPKIEKAVQDADLLIFVVPHQFLLSVAQTMKGKVKATAKGITLVKGLHVENYRPVVFTDLLESVLGIDFCALCGANVAKDVANKEFCETTIGFQEREIASLWQQLFERPYFRVRAVPDIKGVQLCGALKNLIAVAAGFCDGMGMGTNTKSAIIRIGIDEMKLLSSIFFNGILEETFFDSAGFADVITTCFGGRNVKCAAEFVRRPEASWDEIEMEILQGQKMQGQLICEEVYRVLTFWKLTDSFPLFHTTYRIAFENCDPKEMFKALSELPSTIKRRSECQEIPVPPPFAKLKEEIVGPVVWTGRARSSPSSTPYRF